MKLQRAGRHARRSDSGALFQQSFLLTLSNGASAGGGFIAWSIVARGATAHAVGIATGIFASCSFLSYITSLALPYGLLQYGHGKSAPRLLFLATIITSVTSIIGAIIFALGSTWWDPVLSPELDHPGDITIYCVFNVVVGVSILIDAYLVARRHAGVALGRNIFAAVLKIGAVIVLASSDQLRADTIYFAMLAPVGVSLVWVSIPFISDFVKKFFRANDTAASEIFMSYSIKTFPSVLLDGAPLFVLPVVALRLIGPTANAYFYIAWSVSGVVGMLSVSVGQVALRETASLDDRGVLGRKAIILALVVTGLAVLILFPISRFILEIFGPKYVQGSVVPLRLLLLATIPAAHVTITIALLRGQNRHRAVTQASIAYASLSIGATVCFGVIAGVTGVCLGWLVGVSGASLATAFIARQRTELPGVRDIRHVANLEDHDEHSESRLVAAVMAKYCSLAPRVGTGTSSLRSVALRSMDAHRTAQHSRRTSSDLLASWHRTTSTRPARAFADER